MMNYYETLENCIKEHFGDSVTMTGRSSVFGGDINEAYRLELSDGNQVFVKMNQLSNLGFFETEAKGLAALAKSKNMPIPKLLGYGKNGGKSFLMMEYVKPGRPSKKQWEEFGHNLAYMHLADCGDQFGFEIDNYIGATPQKNDYRKDWITFYQECRLKPQIEMAAYYFDTEFRKKLDDLVENLDRYIIAPKKPSVIHGDLWSGNALHGADGVSYLIDPATYYGHFEAELAMTKLFGGFPMEFYQAYFEVNKPEVGFQERVDIYNLYHLLNHLNLFGYGYLGDVKRIVNRYSK